MLILIIIGVATVCGAVIFYFIGVHNATCDDIPAISPIREGNTLNISGTTPSKHGQHAEEDGRLPRHIEPMLYRLELFPDIYGNDSSQFHFTGTMWLKFKCTERSRNITMNINKLELVEASISVGTLLSADGIGDAIEVVGHEINVEWQFLIIYLDEMIATGVEYFVSMNFTGPLKTDFAGFYLSTFPQRTVKKYMAATQFSPTDARKAFPCLDEPNRKAEFEITLVRRSDMVSISNMPLAATHTRGTTFVADVYQRTPKMSTYLLAMVVGDLVSITRQARQGLNYTSWAGIEYINKTEYVLTFGANILSFFEHYFGINFPLPKQDILAVPETAVGAMENWGLIIFTQDRILYQEGENSLNNLMKSSITISHELAHQWFGNLVSANWWSDLFLKEGFAVYFSDVGISDVYPAWNVMDQFATRYMHSVFDDDGLVTSHPVYKELSDTTDIRQVFDSISYTKGGCMIRMLHFILGDTDFQLGLKRYLQQHRYGSVGHNDLWEAIEPPSVTYYHPSGVKDVMDTWILQKNYPVVTIRQMKPGVLKIKQERFLNNPSEAVNDTDFSPFNYIWKIPLTFTTNSNSSFIVTHNDILWLEDKELIVIDRQLVNLDLPDNWIIGNIQQWGYYRVNYDEKVWNTLIDQMKGSLEKIHLVNRAQIINDLFSLAKAKMVPLKTALSALEYLRLEHEYVPWIAAIKEIHYLNDLVEHTPAHDNFQYIIIFFVETVFRNLESNRLTLTMEQQLLRSSIYDLACNLEMPMCIEQSEKAFILWKKGEVQLDPNVRLTILCSSIKESTVSDWNFVLHRYNTTLNIDEKNAYLNALTCTKNGALQDRLLHLVGDPSTIQGRDVSSTLTWLAHNPTAVGKVWVHVKQGWQKLMDTFAGSLFLLSSLVGGITAPFNTQEQLLQLKEFIATTADLGPAEQSFKQAVESTQLHIDWLSYSQSTIEKWIEETSAKFRL